jgi:hypothetical protein
MPYIKLDSFSGIRPRMGPTQLANNEAQQANNVRLTSGELRSWKEKVKVYQPAVNGTSTIYKLRNTNTSDFRWLEWQVDVDVVRAPIADDNDFRVYYTGDGEPRKTNWNLATTTGSGVKPFPNGYLSLAVPPPTTAPSLSASGGTGSDEDRAYLYTYISTFGAVTEESQPSPAATVTCKEVGATVAISGFTTTGTYSQTDTTITVTETGHLLTGGQQVYLDFTSGLAADGWYTVASIVDGDTYTVEAAVSESTSGNVTVLAKLPAGTYNITGRRIYRTVVGAGTVSYQLVDEIPLSTTTYSDTKTVTDLGPLLQTQNWNPPPSDLKGLVAMPNGMLAAFRKNEVWFAEPYHPHAWPDLYTLVVDAEIVGLGVYDTTLVVLTKGQPYLLTGGTPLAISQTKLPMNQPCLSKRSIASDQYGVVYASPYGLVSIGTGTQDVVTLPLYTQEEWQKLNPGIMNGVIYNNLYIGFCQQGATIKAIIIARADNPPLVVYDFPARAVYIDQSNGELFAVSDIDNTLYQLDADPINRTFYEWLSKKFILPNPMNFVGFKIHANYGAIADGDAYNALVAELEALNAALFTSSGGALQGSFNEVVLNNFTFNGSILANIPPQAGSRSINVFIYGDGQLIYSGGVGSPETVRLPSGFKAYEYEVEFSGNVDMRVFAMATSIQELRML